MEMCNGHSFNSSQLGDAHSRNVSASGHVIEYLVLFGPKEKVAHEKIAAGHGNEQEIEHGVGYPGLSSFLPPWSKWTMSAPGFTTCLGVVIGDKYQLYHFLCVDATLQPALVLFTPVTPLQHRQQPVGRVNAAFLLLNV